MAEGIFGLIGVLVGGVIGGWATYLRERRREHAAVRLAARLVLAEFHRNLARMTETLDLDDWGPLGFETLKLSDWAEYRATLGEALHWDVWFDVWRAARTVDRALLAWRLRIEEESESEHPGTTLEPAERELLQAARDDTIQALVLLHSAAMYGARRRRLARLAGHLWRKVRPLDEEKLIEEAERRVARRVD